MNFSVLVNELLKNGKRNIAIAHEKKIGLFVLRATSTCSTFYTKIQLFGRQIAITQYEGMRLDASIEYR